jgi:hypothetical protein
MDRSYRADCPHCQTDTLFKVTGAIQSWLPVGGRHGGGAKTFAGRGNTTRSDCGVCCPECEETFVLILECAASPGGAPTALDRFFGDPNAAFVQDEIHWRVLDVRGQDGPKAFLPERIRQPFSVASEDARRRRNPAGLMAVARGCLDVALKELGETQGGRKKRIENLAAQGVVTKSIAEWANRLWEDGNDAVHDLEADIDVAIEHIKFLDLFFEVAFKLPLQVKAAEAHIESLALDQA